jgi:hypothetical protein
LTDFPELEPDGPCLHMYAKGKDIKTEGDCLVNCFKYRIEYFAFSSIGNHEHRGTLYWDEDKPEDFEGW